MWTKLFYTDYRVPSAPNERPNFSFSIEQITGCEPPAICKEVTVLILLSGALRIYANHRCYELEEDGIFMLNPRQAYAVQTLTGEALVLVIQGDRDNQFGGQIDYYFGNAFFMIFLFQKRRSCTVSPLCDTMRRRFTTECFTQKNAPIFLTPMVSQSVFRLILSSILPRSIKCPASILPLFLPISRKPFPIRPKTFCFLFLWMRYPSGLEKIDPIFPMLLKNRLA